MHTFNYWMLQPENLCNYTICTAVISSHSPNSFKHNPPNQEAYKYPNGGTRHTPVCSSDPGKGALDLMHPQAGITMLLLCLVLGCRSQGAL